MAILTPHLAHTLRMFVQAEGRYAVLDFLSLKEALHVTEQITKQLLAPETISVDTKEEQILVDTGDKYKRKSYTKYWDDIEEAIHEAIGIHFPRNAETPIEQVHSPYPIDITRFINLIIAPLITELSIKSPKEVYSDLLKDDNIFAAINKYVDEVDVSFNVDDIFVSEITLNKRASQYKNPRKKILMEQRRKGRRYETQRHLK